jgi:hypothetical protein
MTVRRLERGTDDGFRSELVPGVKSSADAERLADELAFAQARLRRLADDPPGLYAEISDPAGDIEERSWLAFLAAYLGPREDESPFADIEAARTSWRSTEAPELAQVRAGPRGAYDPESGAGRTLEAYRAWAERGGSQAAAFTGEASWTPERRFARVLERLALPAFPRGARFELLTILGWTGVYELRAGALALGGSDPVTVAAKRLLGIGDVMLLERRAAELADACDLPLETLDVAFFNWERGERARLGMPPELAPDPAAQAAARGALGL